MIKVGGGRKPNADPPMSLVISTELIIVLKQTTQIHPFILLSNSLVSFPFLSMFGGKQD